ncbi:hypothetical protein BB561_001374 [Smittium simulii]|uniref:Uncharacterized protein n=1 Tax=Smittium simulii TaxID=133385 RepID=A0A2T9YUY4_9FUNG|nr:hypothetical protein BB561_001374 [Smittium simulii]
MGLKKKFKAYAYNSNDKKVSCALFLCWIIALWIFVLQKPQENIITEANHQAKFTKLRKGSELRRFDYIVSFGDGASDTGNYYKISKGKSDRSSVKATKRFCEGKVWVDHLSDAFGARSINNAYGFATVNRLWITHENRDYIPGLKQQVEKFAMEAVDNLLPSNETLYTIWAGSNDLIGISTEEYYKKQPDFTIGDVLGDIAQSIAIDNYIPPMCNKYDVLNNLLINHPNIQAKNILVLSVIPMEHAPLLKQIPEGMKDMVIKNVNIINKIYASRLKGFIDNKKLNFVFYDAHKYLGDIYKNYEKYGLHHVEYPCIASPRRRCRSPSEFFWYDLLHIGSTGHLFMALDLIKSEYSDAVVA